MNHQVGVASNGDSDNRSTWSGTPHYLLRAGRASGFLKAGLDLRLDNVGWKRKIWHAGRILRGERPRGFQYSSPFLGELGRKTVEECRRLELQEVISHYQLLPATFLLEHSILTSYYLDTTLQELFSTHEMFTWLNEKVARKAIEAEAAGYQAASRVVAMAGWVRTSLQDFYGVADDHIHTVLPGANLPEDAVDKFLNQTGPTTGPDRFTSKRPFQLGFTGKDWRRKGLARLIAAVEILNRAGIPTLIVVIGNLPREYQGHPNIRPAGFINKSGEVDRFIETLASCDLGCAPSLEEPMGIAPLEYLRLGIPVLCTAAGGLIDVCDAAGPASILLSKDATAEEIASELETLARNPDSRFLMRDYAWKRKEHFRWERTVLELERIWAK